MPKLHRYRLVHRTGKGVIIVKAKSPRTLAKRLGSDVMGQYQEPKLVK